MSVDQRLSAKVEDGELVIRIGINTVAWAFDHDPENNVYDEKKAEYVQAAKVLDAAEFANDVVIEMTNEEEDGTTPLDLFLDKMCRKAANQGSAAIAESGEIVA